MLHTHGLCCMWVCAGIRAPAYMCGMHTMTHVTLRDLTKPKPYTLDPKTQILNPKP